MSPPWVLAIDDDADIRDMLEIALALSGVRLVAVGDVRAAIEAIAGASPPALVLLDLMMPLHGSDLARELRSLPGCRHVPIVVMSGSSYAAEEARKLGAAACLRKPIELDHLLAAIAPFLRRAA